MTTTVTLILIYLLLSVLIHKVSLNVVYTVCYF